MPEGDYTVPIGVADIKREGTDVTVACYAQGVHLALQAGRQLAEQGIELEVVDLRTLKPLDIETLGDSVRKTGRLVVVSEGARAGGLRQRGRRARRSTRHTTRCARRRCGSPRRTRRFPTPRQLERAVMPQVDDLVAAVTGMLEAFRGRDG